MRSGTSSEIVNSAQNESDRSDDVDDDGEEESGWNGNNGLGTSTLTQSTTESEKKDLEKGIFQNKI